MEESKYKVTLYLMIDPSINDKTIKRTYNVLAQNEADAYTEADIQHSNDDVEYKYLSIFDYKIKKS